MRALSKQLPWFNSCFFLDMKDYLLTKISTYYNNLLLLELVLYKELFSHSRQSDQSEDAVPAPIPTPAPGRV